MARAKADRLLQRINTLHDNFSDGSQPSKLERDLMLGYLRDLYEEYAPETEDQPRQAREPEQGTVVERRPPAPVPPPTPSPAAPPPTPSVPVPPPPAPPVEVENVVTATPQPMTVAPDIEELFERSDEGDLAARLSRQPIRDLTRAMTINNRVMFSKVLFDGQGEEMNRVLQQLNGLSSMDAARPVLVDLAQRHAWVDEGKKSSAREFIELVSRRYA